MERELQLPAHILAQTLVRRAKGQQIRVQDEAAGEVCGDSANLREADRAALGTDIPGRCRSVAG
eukprot:8013753-Lingulodinium_polyedra.AAC.1